jgi:hypothetical protein
VSGEAGRHPNPSRDPAGAPSPAAGTKFTGITPTQEVKFVQDVAAAAS